MNPSAIIEAVDKSSIKYFASSMSNFLVTTIINVFSSSRFSGHEKYGPMSPYGDYNKERVNRKRAVVDPGSPAGDPIGELSGDLGSGIWDLRSVI